MLLWRRAPLLAFALAASACSSGTSPPPPPPPPSSVPAEAPAPPTRLEGVDLLHAAPTTVTVSTAFMDVARDVPFIADGDAETAWSSRVGEMGGAFIEVRVPDDAHVTGFSMTVGYTREGEPDVFLKNPRIARVSVSHEGVALYEYDLDVTSRALQTIPLEGPGGLYRIDVVSVVHSVQPDSARVFVTELRVWGTPSSVVESEPSFQLDHEVVPFSPASDLGPVYYLPDPMTLEESRAAIAAFAETWSASDGSDEEFLAAARAVPIQRQSAANCEWSLTLLNVRRARFQRRLDRWIADARRGNANEITVDRAFAIHRVEVFRERMPQLTTAQMLRTRPPEGDTFAAPWNDIRTSTTELYLLCGL